MTIYFTTYSLHTVLSELCHYHTIRLFRKRILNIFQHQPFIPYPLRITGTSTLISSRSVSGSVSGSRSSSYWWWPLTWVRWCVTSHASPRRVSPSSSRSSSSTNLAQNSPRSGTATRSTCTRCTSTTSSVTVCIRPSCRITPRAPSTTRRIWRSCRTCWCRTTRHTRRSAGSTRHRTNPCTTCRGPTSSTRTASRTRTGDSPVKTAIPCTKNS